MNVTTRIDDAIERIELQEAWADRLNNLDMSRRAFCMKHGINVTVLCRYEKLKMAAGWEWINRMESALKSEGV